MKMTFASSLVLITSITALTAVERPESLDERPTEQRNPVPKAQIPAQRQNEPPPSDVVNQEQVNPNQQNQPNNPENNPFQKTNVRPWLGVASEPVSEALASHLKLVNGVQLLLVQEGSPAHKAGLREHDIILSIGQEPIADIEELRLAIQKHHVGENIEVEFISGGERKTAEVPLEARPAELGHLPQHPRQLNPWERNGAAQNPQGRRLPDEFGQQLFPDEFLDERLREQMEQLEKRFNQLHGGRALKMGLRFNDLLNDMPQNQAAPDQEMNLQSSSKIMLRDEEGAIEMTVQQGKKSVVVQNANGKILFDGPWDTEEDKAKASPEIRARVDQIIGEKCGGVHLQWGHPKAKDE